MRDAVDLGIPGLRPLAFLAEHPDRWRRLHERLHRTVFLRSEGTVVTLGPPQRCEGPLLATCREVVARFDRFYAGAARAYFERPELRREFLVNPLLDPLIEIDREARSTAPLARLDCVLRSDGSVRVIEINPVGVNLLHLRSLLYLVRGLARAGLDDAAAELDAMAAAMVAAFDRYYRQHQDRPRRRPTLGALTPQGWMRATHLLFRDAFRRAGWDYAFGSPAALDVTGDGIRLAGQPIDLLWPDFLFYIAYQEARYSQTRFPSALADFSSTPAQAAAILADPRFLDHLRSRRVIAISPATSYLALPKSLLSWIHDPERPVPPGDREWLAAHVARTFSARDRRRGALSIEEGRARKDELLVKPCQYGGSHGVRLGRDLDDPEWAHALEGLWDDETWAVQEFCPPVRTGQGEFLSLGLASFDGELGGITLRTAPARVVSARDSAFVPVVTG
jgi:glutathionylspermidine synthase